MSSSEKRKSTDGVKAQNASCIMQGLQGGFQDNVRGLVGEGPRLGLVELVGLLLNSSN